LYFLFPGELYSRKRRSLATGFVIDKPVPSVGTLAVGECCADAAVFIIFVTEKEPDFVIPAFALGNRS
jgi:hypothetical protein